jgi:hypothetical protein
VLSASLNKQKATRRVAKHVEQAALARVQVASCRPQLAAHQQQLEDVQTALAELTLVVNRVRTAEEQEASSLEEDNSSFEEKQMSDLCALVTVLLTKVGEAKTSSAAVRTGMTRGLALPLAATAAAAGDAGASS